MQNLKILNKKEIKNILDIIKKQFGADFKSDYVFLISEKNKIYIVNRDIERIDLSKLRVNSYGIYFGELRNDELRFSVEGSQIIGKIAKKNVVELDDKNLKDWFNGLDLDMEFDRGFVILKHKDDFVGCGKSLGDKILNYLPKIRRFNIDS